MPGAYDPNCEPTNVEKVIAGHWELMRRNKEFRALSVRWLGSEEFRRAHALSPNYYDRQRHTPRCAWDWMLTAAQRVRLAKFQIEKLTMFSDNDLNFGPITCHENFSPAARTGKNAHEFLRVESLPNAPPPITVDQPWNCTPGLFKKQFCLAKSSTKKFGEVNSRLDELGNLIRIAAKRLAAGDPLKESSIIAHHLYLFGSELRDLAEFSKIFNIPKRRYSEKQFKTFLNQIHDSFKACHLLFPTKLYDTHESFQGTKEDWRWFLEAESLGLDIRKSADLATLSERYSQTLRQRAMYGEAPPRAKAHGFTGSRIPGKVIKNRRSVVKRHVLTIEKWIRAAFPRDTPEPVASVS